ncbi:hypothetical protein G6L32_14730 [Agrobacterium tumefaciens]|uniref:S-adenosylmethionine decarboxylase family protein n=1 Tax=Agrobacterium tumefaciens TaxID=358 RepID=UPI001573F95E|nr:hypothetical protein [Agrobacterium tumefaciens]
MKYENVKNINVRQLFVDAYGCEGDLSNISMLASCAESGIRLVGADIRNSATEYFQPHGATIVYILAESHVIITTWPEYKYVAIDILLCNRDMDPRRVSTEILKSIAPLEVKEQIIDRLIYKTSLTTVSDQVQGIAAL